MNIRQYVKEAFSTIKGNPLRSFLSILGIVIGIVSVVVMLGIGKGAEKKLMDELGELAKNQIQVLNYGGREGKKKLSLRKETINFLETMFPNISHKIGYSASHSETLPIKNSYGNNKYMNIFGVPVSRFKNNDKELVYGTFFTPEQFDASEPVAVIDENVYQYYFKNKKNPIGEKIIVGGKTFAVIGVIKTTSPEANLDYVSYEIWLPYSTFSLKYPNARELYSFTIYLDATADNTLWQKRISYALMKYYNISHVSQLSFEISSFAKYIDKIKDQQKMMNYLLLAIGSISLLVGGIGVMNIMLVSVTERTKEIGIRKAVGALQVDIILQFLIESLLVTLLGGVIAVILSYAVEYLINTYGEAMQLHSMITLEVIGIALIITSFTGILFGILPARRAAKMKPIDALRYE